MPDYPGFCCAMRRKFLVGVVMEAPDLADPIDLVDFLDWDQKTQGGRPIIRIRYCPFCGTKIGDQPLRTTPR